MAIIKSSYTSGNGRLVMPSPYVAKTVTEEIITHVFKEDMQPGDILELAYLPPYCRVLGATVVSTNLVGGQDSTFVNIGFMSGEVGSDDKSRTVGKELFPDLSDTTTEQDMKLKDVVNISKSDSPRSIGLTTSVSITGNPTGGKKLWLRIRYATGISDPR